MDALVGDDVKERRLLKLHRQPLAKRTVEYGIAGCVQKIRKNDGVFTRQRRAPVKVEESRACDCCQASCCNGSPVFREGERRPFGEL